MTRRIVTLCATLALLFAWQPRTTRAQNFEGTLTFNVTIPMLGASSPVVVSLKPGKVRMDMSMLGTKNSIYIDKTGKVAYMVTEGEQKGVKSKMPEKSERAKVDAAMKLEATGKSETINGFKAREFISRGKNTTLHVWGTADIPTDVSKSFYETFILTGEQDPNQMAAYYELADQGLMLVRFTAGAPSPMDPKQEMTAMTMELTSIEKKSLPDALFTPPNIPYEEKTGLEQKFEKKETIQIPADDQQGSGSDE